MKQVSTAEIEQLIRGEHGQPHAILGPHPDGDGVTIRSFKPLARTVTAVLANGTRVPLDVKPGDLILFGKYASQDIKLDGEELLIMRETDVLAVLETPTTNESS